MSQQSDLIRHIPCIQNDSNQNKLEEKIMVQKQLRDPWVLEVQQWLNQTYSGVSGFGTVVEDGFTGWDTINGLIRGLQHELGITDLVNNFGDTTKRLWDEQVAPKLSIDYEANFVKLIDGAFRCKGFGSGKFTTIFTQENEETLLNFKSAAGFDGADASFSSLWAKALFDMSAFALVSGGDLKTQQMQKDLNKKYYSLTGILPCDGIYQRATNTALIYGVQYEMGLESIANGVFGPTTQSTYATYAANGIQNYPNLILLIQYALYQNLVTLMKDLVAFSSDLDSATETAIVVFQSFLNIYDDVQIGYPDLTTMMSLMLSSGSGNRSYPAVDTAEQLTPEQIRTLADNDIKYVGRYLTGTVGDDFIPKYLTLEEANNIINAGMAIIPIYQDNNPVIDYYKLEQGVSDAMAAFEAADALGFEEGTVIYFAVDVDALDTDITNNIIPYFSGIYSECQRREMKYRAGVYGTRNVCIRVKENVHTSGSYVSNMSTGWSGNLGFSQPNDWMFDQFNEPTGGIGTGEGQVSIDKVNASRYDTGVTSVKEVLPEASLLKRLGIKLVDEMIESESFDFGVRNLIWTGGPVELYMTLEAALQAENPNANLLHTSISVDNGKLDGEIFAEISAAVGDEIAGKIEASLSELTPGIESGNAALSISYNDGKVSFELTLNMEDFDISGSTIAASVKFELEFDLNQFNNTLKLIFDFLVDMGTKILGFILAFAAILLLLLIISEGVAVSAVVGVASLVVFLYDSVSKAII